VLLQVILAMIMGGAIGWEREEAGKFAGLRTHMLVAVSSMLFVSLGTFLIRESGAGNANAVRGDPVRTIEAIATGVAFIGAGTIFRDRGNHARGLTTAASLLVTASIGIAVALNAYVVAVGVTIICLIILRVVAWIESRAISKT
jgi:putative Mg2+ transporter-C (MgtC) family protein